MGAIALGLLGLVSLPLHVGREIVVVQQPMVAHYSPVEVVVRMEKLPFKRPENQ